MARRKRRFPWGWTITAVLILGGAGFGVQQMLGVARAEEIPRGVQVGTVTRGDVDQKITATGVVAAQTGAKVNIGSQITGRIRSLPADVGSTVQANQVIAVLDAPDLEAQVEQQRRNVEVARAEVAQSESRLRQARLTAGLTKDQTEAQITEAEFAQRAAEERVRMADATSRLQPSQTEAEITRAESALSTARSQQKQVRASVELQIRQAVTEVNDARALVDNMRRLVRRRQTLFAQGYVARQELEDAQTELARAQARLEGAEASERLVREKTEADLQAAADRVAEAEAARRVALAGRLQDEMRAAELRNAQESARQSNASLRLRKTGRTEAVIRQRAVDEASAALRRARAGLLQAEALLRYQQAQLDKAVIRSPIDGVVLTIAAQQGETIAAGLSAPTLITVADLKRLEVRAFVDEVDISRVRIGLPCEVRVDALSNRVFRGRVSKLSAASTIKDNVVTYETTIALDDPGGVLRPDMTADVTLILGRRKDVLLVPSESLHRELTRTVVYVLHRNKKGKERVETRAVQTGVDDGSQAEIREGLKEGDEVILAGLPRLGVQPKDSQQRRPGAQEDE